MYQVSRAIYRELARDIEGGRLEHERVLQACERTIERLFADHHYFARPARTLFHEIRPYIPMQAQPRVWRVLQSYVEFARELIERTPVNGLDPFGEPLRCRATTRRGTACQRVPLNRNGYCPSHQHLAETEDIEVHELEPAAA